MTIKRNFFKLSASVFALALVLPTLTAQPVEARGVGGIKPAFTAASKGGAKAVKPSRPGGSGARAGGFKGPKVKPGKPGGKPRPISKPIQPGGKPGMTPGLPKPRPIAPRAGGTGAKPNTVKGTFNKQAQRKPLKEVFNPAANPPKKKPAKADPPPTPAPRPKGPFFKPPGF
jgi:hypothetical protein